MTKQNIKLGIVGVGKIVRDQHLPAIETNSNFELVAAASRNASIDGIASYKTIEEMIAATSDLQAVALCMPPQFRYAAAKTALEQGLHVLLEKPPGATVLEVESLAKLADQHGASLFATWHSRHGAAVSKAKQLLEDRQIQSVRLDWKENVRKWHPNQDWIWQAGGLGVFDPGINGLSILTHLLDEAAFVQSSELTFPANKAAPIAAKIQLTTPSQLPISVDFDWQQTGDEVWNIHFNCDEDTISIMHGGEHLLVNEQAIEVGDEQEYPSIYQRFAEIINNGLGDVDLAPLKIAADAFLMGERTEVEAFIE